MERFEVFNRATGQWENENISIVPGWSLNWVQDKTTDTMQLKVKYKSETAPNWNNGDWCRILHLSGDETGATYKDVIYERIPAGDLANKLSVRYDADLGNNGGFVVECTEILTEEIKVEIYYVTSDDDIHGHNNFRMLTMEEGTDSVTYLLGDEEHYNTTIVAPVSIYQIYRYSWVHLPKNHEQFIIGGISLVQNKIAGEWDCQLTLKEPIEITNGILVETRSFTNQISKIIDNVEYTHDALTHLSVLETILKTTPANNDLSKSWYSRIKLLNKDLLASTAFNDETFSEQSLYGILMEKYDSSLGRTPVLYFDINAETDLPNDLTRNTYLLDFLRQDGFDKESINLSVLKNNSNEEIINKSDDNYTDGIVSNYDNLSIQNDTYFPSENYYAMPEVDTNERSLTRYTSSGIDSEWILRIPHKIKSIIGVTRYKIKAKINVTITIVGTTLNNYTITESKEIFSGLIMEEKVYNAESDSNKRNNAIWFTEGSNIVHLNEMHYYSDNGAYTNECYVYCINYVPIVDARFDLGKDYQIQLNQNDSQVDSVKFGQYIQNYLASMNKADLIITKTVDNFNDIVEIGTRVIDGDKTYLITNVSIQNRGFDYDVVYQLNENHLRKSDSIVASQEIRKNIEIGIDATKERKSMLPFNYKISLEDTNSIDSLGARNYICSSLLTSRAGLGFIQTALLKMKGNYKNQGSYSIERYCDVIKYAFNNTFCLNMRYFDNAEAGRTKTLQEKTAVDSVTLTSRTVYGVPKAQMPVLYTNYFGEFEKFDIMFTRINNNIFDDYLGENTYDLNDNSLTAINNVLRKSSEYPLKYANGYPQSIISISDINYYKDMLDTFNYTIGFHIDSDKQIILCQAFFNNSILIERQGAKISAIKTYSQNMQENDYAITNYVETSSVVGTLNGNEITIQLNNALNTAKSVILVDSNDKPLLIINDFEKVIDTNTFDNIKLYC